MSRRRFLRSSAALISVASADWLLADAAPAVAGPAEAAPAPFDYARLKGIARAGAAQPYVTTANRLPPAIAALDWDQAQPLRVALRGGFGGGDLVALGEHVHLTPVITTSRGRIELPSARPLVPLGLWRVTFDLALDRRRQRAGQPAAVPVTRWAGALGDLALSVHPAAACAAQDMTCRPARKRARAR